MALPVDVYTCQVRINMMSGITADAATNTFHFRWDGAGDPVENDFLTGPYGMLDAFYTAVGTLLSTEVDASNIDLKIYEGWTAPPRTPVYINTMTPINRGGTYSPAELSMVLSFQGAPSAGVPQARRRNRVYIGPLGFVATGNAIPANKCQQLVDAGDAMLVNSAALANWTWVAASPTYGTAVPVTNGWVDNAWDIQRRRGWDATERYTFS
jgi:hypothetical protein